MNTLKTDKLYNKKLKILSLCFLHDKQWITSKSKSITDVQR